MLEKYMEKDLGVRVSADQPQGIDLGDGNIKTSRGTIRTPKSSLTRARLKDPEQPTVSSKPVYVEQHTVAEPVYDNIPVVIHSDFGDIIYNCIDVVKTGQYLVLEMLQDNFAPKSYAEAPNLRLPISWEGNNGTYVFTGCKWMQKRTKITFLILMEVSDDE